MVWSNKNIKSLYRFNVLKPYFCKKQIMEKQIVIIGAGVSGLVAALQLEEKGYKAQIFDGDSKIGGRVQSDSVDGYALDRGFQVLLTAYPLAKKYLDFKALDLKAFRPGAYVFKKDKRYAIGDPLRDFSLLWGTLFSNVGTVTDKLKIFKLTSELKKKSIDAIFSEKGCTTLDYLVQYGFSKAIIQDFFKPFFSGIFLETELSTPSVMFEFIFKMFGEGKAAVPKAGIQAIPNQLASNLKQTRIETSKKVNTVIGTTLTFEDGTTQDFDYCIIATDAAQLIPNLAGNDLKWKHTQTLYFTVKTNEVFEKQMIGLASTTLNTLINSVCFPEAQNTNLKLLSVSVVKSYNKTPEDLVTHVSKELETHFNIKVVQHLKTYTISKALPDLEDVRYTMRPSESQLTSTVFLAGDTLLNGSLNAAMLSGELAAKAVHEKITGDFMD